MKLASLAVNHVEVNRVRANGEGMGCTQREPQQPCSVQAQGVTANNHFDTVIQKISIRAQNKGSVFCTYSTVRISGPPEFTKMVCSNCPIIPPSWHPNA